MKLMFTLALTVFLVYMALPAAAGADQELVSVLQGHTTYLDAWLDTGDEQIWSLQLDTYGTLLTLYEFPEAALDVSLWSLHQRSAVRIAHWTASSERRLQLALAPGSYELRVRAIHAGLFQMGLQFQQTAGPPADGPQFQRGTTPELPLHTLVSGYFGFRHPTTPVFPSVHYRGLATGSDPIVIGLYNLSGSRSLQLSQWTDGTRQQYTSITSGGQLLVTADARTSLAVATSSPETLSHYVVYAAPQQSTEPLRLVTGYPANGDAGVPTDQVLLLGFNQSAGPDTTQPGFRVTDTLGRSLPAKIVQAGALWIIEPIPSWPSNQWLHVDIRPPSQTSGESEGAIRWRFRTGT